MYFSVIVPVYNVEKYLSACVESVLAQTYQDFELILVDDGSSDSSGKLCDAYAAKDSRVKAVHKPNGGQSTARNLGLRHAGGKYVCFLDSDDFYASDRFLEEIHQTVETGADMVLFRYCKYYEDGRRDFCGISMAGLDGLNKENLLRELVCRDAFFCSCWSKAVCMDILKEAGIKFDEGLSCEDMDWFYNVVTRTDTIRVIDSAYVNYRQRENSVTSSFKVKTVVDYLTTLRKWSGAFAQIENETEKKVMLSSLAKLYCNLLITYTRHSGQLKAYKKEIFSFRYLLAYDLNPRTRIIRKVSDIVGLEMTCLLLKILDKVR